MTFFRLTVGSCLLALLLPSVGHAQAASSISSSSAPSTLYTRIKQQVEKETSQETFDDDIVTYLQLLFEEKWSLDEEQIQNVLRGDSNKACAAADDDSELRQRLPCQSMADIVLQVARQEQRVRGLGRNLTALITGYELPLSDLPERTLHLSSDLLGILNIWSAGTGNVLSKTVSPFIRTVAVKEDDVRTQLEQVAEELEKLSPEERTAAIWRLRSGARLITDQRQPEFPEPTLPGDDPAGTERQYLDKHWGDLENRLKQLWEAVFALGIDPPLSASETAYAVFPASLVKELLPDNVIIWVRIDGDPRRAYADVGLDWDIPLEPVFPSLKKDGADEVILGGNFPPAPVGDTQDPDEPWNGMQLCTNPLAKRGYLCRPFETLEPGERCPVENPADSDTITLVHCTVTDDKTKSSLQWCSIDKRNGGSCRPLDPNACRLAGGDACGTLEDCKQTWNCTPTPAPAEPVWCCLKNAGNICAVANSSAECVQRRGSPSADEEGCVQNGCEAPVAPDIRYTSGGADVCREVAWKNNEPFDPNTQCTVNLRCATQCNNGSNPAFASAKTSDGSVDVCLTTDPQYNRSLKYLLGHELVHAYQFCGLPPDYKLYEVIQPGDSAKVRQEKYDTNAERCCRLEGEANRVHCGMAERDGLFDGLTVGNTPVDAGMCGEVFTDAGCKQITTDGKNLPGCFLSRDYPADTFDRILQQLNTNPKNAPQSCADIINPQKMDGRIAAYKEAAERRDDVCTPETVTEYRNRIGNNMCYIGQCAEQSLELHRITAGQSPAVTQGAVAPWQEPLTGTPLGNLLSNPPLSQYRFPPYRPELLVRTLDAALCQSAGLPPLMPPVLCTAEATRQLALTRSIGLESVIGLVQQDNQQQIDLRDMLKLSRGIGVRTGTELYSEYLRESSRSFAEVLGIAADLLKQLDSINFPTEMCPISPGLPSPISSASAS